MPRLMSFAHTSVALEKGIDMHIDAAKALGREAGVNALEILCWEWNGSMMIRVFKDVTRRSSWVKRRARQIPGYWRAGWDFLRPGDVVESIEWAPRVGPRWVASDSIFDRAVGIRQYRRPLRLGLREVVSVRQERLGAITEVDVVREGFLESPEWFVARYCAPGKPDPDRPVNRIELKEVPYDRRRSL